MTKRHTASLASSKKSFHKAPPLRDITQHQSLAHRPCMRRALSGIVARSQWRSTVSDMSTAPFTAAPAEDVAAQAHAPAPPEQRSVFNTSFQHNTTGFNRPFVLPARLDRGVDILHDPVFNKVSIRPAWTEHG